MSTTHNLPEPHGLPGYTWRSAQLEDAPAIHQTLIDIDEADNRHWAGTLSELESEFADPDVDAKRDTLVGFTPGGRVAALAWVYAPSKVENKHRAYLWAQVHPQHRTRTMEDFVMAWSQANARRNLCQRNGSLPRLLRGSAMTHDTARIEWFQRHGFEPMRHFFTMRRHLGNAIAEPTLPNHLSIHPWRPEFDQPTFEAFNESFRDHWGFDPIPYETWKLFFTGRDSFRSDLSFVITDGDEIAGFAINYYSPEENERKGIDEAWIGDLGTRRPWRKQGIATALLNHSMLAFRAAGIAHASLGVDSENPTGALGVYERVGFKVVERSLSLGKYIEEGDCDPQQAQPVLAVTKSA
ncbi:MAG: GNAT family N-acetyltransferase [Caldilineales bacterium]|nr:GNAT family N-acetyltransferase [Caldilineales bacterium]